MSCPNLLSTPKSRWCSGPSPPEENRSLFSRACRSGFNKDSSNSEASGIQGWPSAEASAYKQAKTCLKIGLVEFKKADKPQVCQVVTAPARKLGRAEPSRIVRRPVSSPRQQHSLVPAKSPKSFLTRFQKNDKTKFVARRKRNKTRKYFEHV